MITRVYLEGVNVMVQKTEGEDQAVKPIPTRASRFTPDPTNDTLTVSDRDTGDAYTFDYDELRTKTDEDFATKDLAVEYLAGFVGGFKSPQESGDEDRAKEPYKIITTNNYEVTSEDITKGCSLIVYVPNGQTWDLILPASNTVLDDNFLYKIRVIIANGEKLNITINGGEKFARGMSKIVLINKVNDDAIIGAINNQAVGLSSWQRQGDVKIICDVRRTTPLNANQNNYTPINFQVANKISNETITNWDVSNPNFIESLVDQDVRILFKSSLDSTGGGTWNFEMVIRIQRKQTDGSFVDEDLASSRIITGNFGGEDQSLTSYDYAFLNTGDRVQLMYRETNLTGQIKTVGLSISSKV